MLGKIKSRKFWFALLGATLPVGAQVFSQEIDIHQALHLSSAIIVSYIFGQGYVDANANAKVAKKD